MSGFWRLAVWGAALTALLSVLVAGVVGAYAEWASAWAFLYGAGIGVLSFTSIAVTAYLLGGKFTAERLLLGVAVYTGRLVFAAVAMGVPIYLGTWPVLPLICGFAGVYVVENVVLLIGAWRVRGTVSSRGAPRA